MHQTIECDLCDEGIPQSDSHLLDFTKLIQNCSKLANDWEAEHEDIFGDVEKQLRITQIFKEIFNVKETFDDEMSLGG